MFSVNRSEKLLNESKSIANVFRKTVSDLTKINNKIDEEKVAVDKEIAHLTSESDKLEKQRNANERLSGKITSFLED